jgi:RNAse (barnase) inhibitor barstar
MKTKLLFLFIFVISISVFSQEYIFGKVSSEFGNDLQNVTILNIRTDEKAFTDKHGNYMIAAKSSDEIRFVKEGYDRNSTKISAENYLKPVNISLMKSPYLIPEVELAFHATGNLEKDIKNLAPSKRNVVLNAKISNYMRTPFTDAPPQLSIPSAFAAPNFNKGNLNISGIADAISGLIGKARNPITTANFAETQEFYRRIKNTLDLSFYTAQGWDEEEIDRFLIYANETYSLAKKYCKNFDVLAITSDMKMAYREYIKTHKINS